MSRRFLDKGLLSIDNLLKKHPEKFQSYQTRAAYRDGLRAIIKTLHHEFGSNISNIRDLKLKQVNKLVDYWLNSGDFEPGTIKNTMSKIRWVFSTLGKSHLLKSNKEYEIPNRIYKPKENHAIFDIDIQQCQNEAVRYSLRLQQAFGLRREEAIKFQPHYADNDHHIRLKGSWTKGGIPRIVPILNDEQRKLLDELKKAVPRGQSLIPQEKSYAEQLNIYRGATESAGFKRLHGLRHAYAQRRYIELTNEYTQDKDWKPPLQGGKIRKMMTREERYIDKRARLVIATELGHSRLNIVATYLG